MDDADLPKLGAGFFSAERSRQAPGAGPGRAMAFAAADIHAADRRMRNLRPGLAVDVLFRASSPPAAQ